MRWLVCADSLYRQMGWNIRVLKNHRILNQKLLHKALRHCLRLLPVPIQIWRCFVLQGLSRPYQAVQTGCLPQIHWYDLILYPFYILQIESGRLGFNHQGFAYQSRIYRCGSLKLQCGSESGRPSWNYPEWTPGRISDGRFTDFRYPQMENRRGSIKRMGTWCQVRPCIRRQWIHPGKPAVVR